MSRREWLASALLAGCENTSILSCSDSGEASGVGGWTGMTIVPQLASGAV